MDMCDFSLSSFSASYKYLQWYFAVVHIFRVL